MSSTNWDLALPSCGSSPSFTQQQIAQLAKWQEGREEWQVQVVDSVEIDAEMIVVELPPYLDIDGLGLNLRNWVIYPALGNSVRVLFWDEHESLYPALESALRDIAMLRALKT